MTRKNKGKHQRSISRRESLKLIGKTACASALAPQLLSSSLHAVGGEKKYLFVIAAAGGATLVDSFLPQTEGPTAYASDQIIQPNGSNIRAVLPLDNSIQGVIPLGNEFSLGTFLTKHKDDVAVLTSEVTSVNHIVAAQRAVTGDNINGGITINEAHAMRYGSGLALANLNLAGDGYGIGGKNKMVPSSALGIPIADPLMFGFVTHGFKGLNGAPAADDIAQARLLRNELEGVSRFGQRFRNHEMIKIYLENRENLMKTLEKGSVITKMMIFNSPNLQQYELQLSPIMTQLAEKFPNMAEDPLEAKIALSFLAMKYGLTTSTIIEPASNPLIKPEGTPNAPIAFDWSHVDHRGAQNAHWSYVMRSVDALIDLLKSEDVDGDPSQGKMWDRSMIYIATEFGRDKVGGGSSGHHLNNGNVLISPLLKGNRIYGGIDPQTALTYGFDPQTGVADPGRKMTEKDIYSIVAQALGLEFAGRRDLSGLVKV